MNLNDDIFEKETDDFSWFVEDLEAFESLLSKLTYNQRVFLNTFKEIVESDNESEDWLYQHYVLAGCIEMYSRRPDLVPDAPMALLKRCVPYTTHKNEFQQMVDIMTRWADSVRQNKKPINRLVSIFLKLPRYLIYAAFVAVLVFALTSGIQLVQISSYGFSVMLVKQILRIIVSGFVTVALGKAVFIKTHYKYLKSLY